MTAIAKSATGSDASFALLFEEIIENLQSEEGVDVEAYAQKHPEHAERLRRLLPTVGILAELGRSAARQESAGLVSAGAADADLGVLGDFRIVREVGRGGMGVVYEAVQISLKRRVALKVLPFACVLDERQLQRFHNEAQAAACLHHTSIVPVHAVGNDRGVHYYAMQFIEGQALDAVIHDLRRQQDSAQALEKPGGPPTTAYAPPPPAAAAASAPTVPAVQAALSTERSITSRAYFERVARLGIQAAEALDYAHQQGIIHRDVKPANLLLDARGNVWITDFGLAHCQSQAGPTLTGELVGTLRYMSPEQTLAKRAVVDHRTDVYSLGATLYELLTLQVPFPGTDRHELVRQIAFEDPRPPRRINKAVPAELETVVLKTLEKNPAERYATAQDLANDLRRFLEDRPIRAKRPTLLQRARKLARRHHALVWSAAVFSVVLLLLTVAGLATGLMAVNAERERKDIALREAQERLVQIQKGTEILGSIFRDLNPDSEEKEGKDLRVLLGERLDQASRELHSQAIGDPLTVAKLQHVLGDSQIALGYPDKAVQLLTQARATFTTQLGPDHAETLNSMDSLAVAYQAAGKLDLALPLFELTLEKTKAKLGPDHPDTLKSMNNLAAAYRDAGKLDQALPLFELTLEKTKAKLGPDHPDTLTCMNNLALAYLEAGKLGEALPLFELTLEKMKAKLALDHPHTLSCMANLAKAYQDAGKLDKALPLFEQTLEKIKAKLGPDHPHTLTSMHNLAAAYEASDKLDQALQLFELTLEKMKAKDGPDHPHTLKRMNNLANAYLEAGKLDQALPLYELTLEKTKAKLGPDHPETLKSMNNLASEYLDAGKLDQALPLYELTLEKTKAKLGPDHPDTLVSMGNLALAYRAAGKLDLALPLLELTLEKQKAKLEPDHPNTLSTMNKLASAYQDAGKLDLALPLFELTLRKMKTTLGPDHSRTLSTANNLALAYQIAGKLDLALPLYEQTLEKEKAKLGPDHPDTLITMHNLAWAYQAAGRLDEAEPLFCAAVTGARRKLGFAHPRTQIYIRHHADCYAQLMQPEKAEPLQRELAAFWKEKAGADSPRYAGELALLGMSLLQQKKWADTEPILRECLAIRAKKEPEDWRTFNTKSMLGAALLGQKKYADAEPLLLAGYEGMKERQVKIPPAGKVRMVEALERLVQLYDGWSKKDKADVWRKVLEETKVAGKTAKP